MIKTSSGLHLYTKNYIVQHAKANLLLVHGLGEHCQRYVHVAKAFNQIGISVFTFDLRGHGLSEGNKCYVTSIDEYREDVENVYRSIPKDIPFFILGHSMGGLIILDFLLFNEKTDIRGAIFSGAAIEIGEDVTPFTQKIITLLAKVVPKLTTVKIDPTSISRSPKTVQEYKTDPLICRDGTKAGLGVALLNGINKLKPQFNLFNYPVLIMHGEADKVTNPQGSKDLYAKAKSNDKTLKIWGGAFHEIFNELNKDEVINFTTNWVVNRI